MRAGGGKKDEVTDGNKEKSGRKGAQVKGKKHQGRDRTGKKEGLL